MLRHWMVRLALAFAAVSCSVLGISAARWHVDSKTPYALASGPITHVARPRAVVKETEFDFGTMDLGETRSHRFILKNEGDADLVVEKGPTTCSCTLLKMNDGRIAPGESLEVLLEWTAKEETEHFSQGAFLITNDITNRNIQLLITGKMLRRLAVSSDELVFSDLRPGDKGKQTLLVFSQVWSRFSLISARSSLKGVSWTIEPAPTGLLKSAYARSGYEVRVTMDSDGHPTGDFRGDLQLTVVPPESEPFDGKPLKVKISGEVAGRATLYGADVHNRTLLIGSVPEGSGAQREVSIYFRDAKPRFEVKSVKSSAPELQVRLLSAEPVSSTSGRYRFAVTVPAQTSQVNRMGPHCAHVEIETDHPACPTLKFNVEYAVAQDKRPALE